MFPSLSSFRLEGQLICTELCYKRGRLHELTINTPITELTPFYFTSLQPQVSCIRKRM